MVDLAIIEYSFAKKTNLYSIMEILKRQITLVYNKSAERSCC